MIVHFLHGRTHVPLYATPAVANPEVWAVLQSTTTPILRFLYDRFSRKIRHHHFCQLTTSGSGHSDLFSDLFYVCDSRTPFKTHNC
jgi:hypothetical protein